MPFFLSLLVYAAAIVVLARRQAWLQQNLATWAVNASLAGQIAGIVVWREVRRLATIVAVLIVLHASLLFVATLMGYPVFVFFTAVLGGVASLVILQVWALVQGLLLEIGRRIRDTGQTWTNWINVNWPYPALGADPHGNAPAVAQASVEPFLMRVLNILWAPFGFLLDAAILPVTLPPKLGAESVRLLGELILTADRVIRQVARVLVIYSFTCWFIAVAALVDWQLGWHLVTVFNLSMAFLAVAVMSYQTLYELTYRTAQAAGHAPTHLKLPTWIAVSAIAVVTAIVNVGSDHMTVWQFIKIYLMDWRLAVCGITIYLIVAAIYDTHYTSRASTEHGHGRTQMRPWKKTTLNVGAIMFVVFVAYPFLTKDDTPYHWTQRNFVAQLSRWHKVNTTQMLKDTNPDIAAAEAKGQIPDDLDTVLAKYDSSAEVAKKLEDRRKSWDAEVSGRNVAQPRYYVDVHKPWETACIPFYEPMMMTASGYVTNMYNRLRDDFTPHFQVPANDGYEKVGPNGTKQPATVRGYELPLPDENRFLALIGRVADDQTHQPLTKEPFLIGAAAVLSPAVIGASGCLQTAVNKSAYLTNSADGFSVSFHPANRPAAPSPGVIRVSNGGN